VLAGEAVEGKMDYEPTMMPVAVGGYFWVVFTSRRVYGNTIAPGRKPTVIAGDNPTQDPWGSGAAPSQRKKLWVAAIDVDHGMKPDPSHPAFYLPGQEIESANMRAYAALAPCQKMGANCESGADCCDGYCRQNGNDATGAPILQCVPPPVNTCSNIDEPCMTTYPYNWSFCPPTPLGSTRLNSYGVGFDTTFFICTVSVMIGFLLNSAFSTLWLAFLALHLICLTMSAFYHLNL